jgi:hypothetical protein
VLAENSGNGTTLKVIGSSIFSRSGTVANVPGSSFMINLNKAPGTGKTATVAWFVVN